MTNKKCPSCIQRKEVDPVTKKLKLEFVCKCNGYKKCDYVNCPHDRDNYEDNYGSFD